MDLTGMLKSALSLLGILVSLYGKNDRILFVVIVYDRKRLNCLTICG